MNCPGSVNLAATCPTPPTSVYAQEGTAAHKLAELCLTKNVDPTVYVGMTIEGWEVDDDMAENVRVFVDYCRLLPGKKWIEYRFNLAALSPPSAMYGTADFVAYDAATKTLHVVDLKYGMGVVVEAKGNKQLRYYGLGAALALGSEFPVDEVVLTIVQPRAMHPDGAIRSETLPYVDLVEFSAELMAAARATQPADAPLHAGSWCRFCPASGVCPEQAAQAVRIAQADFDILDMSTPTPPELLTDAELARNMELLPILENYAAAMRQYVQAKLERGEAFPGYKMVQKRPTRHWADPKDTEQWLLAQGNTPDEIMVEPKLKSVAQIEKIIGKKKVPAERVVKISSGNSMVHESDPRPAVAVTAGHEFLSLPSGEPEE